MPEVSDLNEAESFYCPYCRDSKVLAPGEGRLCIHYGHFLFSEEYLLPEIKLKLYCCIPRPTSETNLVVNTDASFLAQGCVELGVMFRSRTMNFIWAFSSYGYRPNISTSSEAEVYCLLVALKLVKRYRLLLQEQAIKLDNVVIYTDSKNTVKEFNGIDDHKLLNSVNLCRKEAGFTKFQLNNLYQMVEVQEAGGPLPLMSAM